MMNDLVFLAAHQLAKAIHDRQVSSKEVIEAYLSQIAQYNPQLNAIVTLDAENAIALANTTGGSTRISLFGEKGRLNSPTSEVISNE
jgi:Asp-tRNA(Asn)/Glu-tRNA(Gln) amidotransferase A subunit family amidase